MKGSGLMRRFLSDLWIPALGETAELCGPVLHSLSLSPTPGFIVYPPPPHSPTSILLTSAPFSVTVGHCFSMISRLICGEISSLMVVLD